MTRSPSLRTIRKQSFDSLNRYFSDPSYAAQCQAKDERNHAESMAAMDRAIARLKPSPIDPALIEHERRKRERVEIEHQRALEK
jgi:hypothetical protein